MSADPNLLPVPAVRPDIAIGIDVPLSFLAANEVDISVVIGAVQRAVQGAVNAAPDDMPITLSSIRNVVSEIAGIATVRYVFSDGADVDLPANAPGYLIDVPSQVDASDVRITSA